MIELLSPFQVFLYLLVAFFQWFKWNYSKDYLVCSELTCYVLFIAVHFAHKSARKHCLMRTHCFLLCLWFCPSSFCNIFQRQRKVWCFKFLKIAFVVHANIWKLSLKWTKSDSENCNSSNKTRKLIKTKSFSRSLIGETSIGLAAGSTIIAKINMQCLILLTGVIFSIKYDLCWLVCNYCVPLTCWIIMTFLK